jgi:hypothetical protein
VTVNANEVLQEKNGADDNSEDKKQLSAHDPGPIGKP